MTDLDYFYDLNEKNNIWVGINENKEWVILDRKYKINSPGGKSKKLFFVRISNWTIYDDNYSNWSQPKYIYVPAYIKKTKDENISEAINNLKTKIKEYQDIKSIELEFQFLDLIHKNFLTSKGFKQSTIQKSSGKFRRISHCWNCKETVDNQHDYECSSCKWIICSNCGACKLNGC